MQLKINGKQCKFDGKTDADAATLIRSVMQYDGVFQEDLAEKLGVSQVAVSRCLSRNMRIETFESILNALGCEIIIDKKR